MIFLLLLGQCSKLLQLSSRRNFLATHPTIFISVLQDGNKKLFFSLSFLLVTFWSYICMYIIFQREKVIKKSHNSRNQGCSYYFCLMIEGSGSGSDTLVSDLSSCAGGSWLLWAHQVPDGPEDHGREAEVRLLQEQAPFHRRLQADVAELQGQSFVSFSSLSCVHNLAFSKWNSRERSIPCISSKFFLNNIYCPLSRLLWNEQSSV